MGFGDTVKVVFEPITGQIVMLQDDDAIVFLPSDVQAVLTMLFQAYADSLDKQKPNVEQQGMK